jgi:uncharacterized protein (TIGR02588 family)
MAKPDHDTPVLEWIAAALGAVALAAVLGVIGYGLATRGDAPPSFRFETLSVTPVGDRWHVAFRVTNTGDAPASTVKVVGQLAPDGETAELTLRYVPDRSSREGGLYFRHDPRAGALEFRVSGYESP